MVELTAAYNNIEFGSYFAQLRKSEGYKSQRDLAEKSGISNATISRLESGATKPSPEVLRDLANCFVTVTYEELMQRAGYLNIESVVHEYKDVYDLKKKLGSRYDDVIYELKSFRILMNSEILEQYMENRKIKDESIAANLGIEPKEFKEVMDKKRFLEVEQAIRLSKITHLPFSDLFSLFAVVNDVTEYDAADLTVRIEVLIQEEMMELKEKALRKQAQSQIKIDRLHDYNITAEEERYLIEQLKLFRWFKGDIFDSEID